LHEKDFVRSHLSKVIAMRDGVWKNCSWRTYLWTWHVHEEKQVGMLDNIPTHCWYFIASCSMCKEC
jgi:hypothetical protein